MIYKYLLFMLVGIFVYKRYVPVNGVEAITEHTIDKDVLLLDLRDYQSTYNKPILGSLNIPFPYLKRYFGEIQKENLIIIASDPIEKNLAVRFLLKRKFSIKGFIILNDRKKEGEQLWNIINKLKTG